MEHQINKVKFALTNMGLNEYQTSALAHLMYLGETKATTLSKASTRRTKPERAHNRQTRKTSTLRHAYTRGDIRRTGQLRERVHQGKARGHRVLQGRVQGGGGRCIPEGRYIRAAQEPHKDRERRRRVP